MKKLHLLTLTALVCMAVLASCNEQGAGKTEEAETETEVVNINGVVIPIETEVDTTAEKTE